MKLNFRPFIAIIVSVFMLIYTGAAVSAEELEVTVGKETVSNIGVGESRIFSTEVHSAGALSLTVDIDSTEGSVTVYDKRNKQLENVHYTSADMPITITVDAHKGKYTMEVTREDASEGSGQVTVNRSFALDKKRLTNTSTVIIIALSVLIFFGLVKGSEYRGSKKGSLFFKNGRATVKDHLDKSVFKSITDTISNVDFFKRFF